MSYKDLKKDLNDLKENLNLSKISKVNFDVATRCFTEGCEKLEKGAKKEATILFTAAEEACIPLTYNINYSYVKSEAEKKVKENIFFDNEVETTIKKMKTRFGEYNVENYLNTLKEVNSNITKLKEENKYTTQELKDLENIQKFFNQNKKSITPIHC